MAQGPRKRLWKGRFGKTILVQDGDHLLTHVEITEPSTESGRLVVVKISPYLARQLAKKYGPWADLVLGPEKK